MARANGIARDNRIYPGQKLRLTEAPTRATTPARAPAAKVPSSTGPVRKPAPITIPRATPSTSAPVAVAPAAGAMVQRAVQWHWPSAGKVLRGFQNRGKVNNGLDIAGHKGAPVFAAAAGRVVYAGSGLLGYGNLIIINHNEEYLSAYAHNSRLLVKENHAVAAGQKIAEIGNSGATRTMLHFEIRKDGKPVNPLHYLPQR